MKYNKILIATLGFAIGFSSGLRGETRNTLYERLGGKPAIEAVVDDLVTRILADSRVNPWFAHTAAYPQAAAAYKAHLRDFICQATGGPCKYTGMDMKAAHKYRAITPAAFDYVVEDLVATLDKFKVAKKEQQNLLEILGPLKAFVVQR